MSEARNGLRGPDLQRFRYQQAPFVVARLVHRDPAARAAMPVEDSSCPAHGVVFGNSGERLGLELCGRGSGLPIDDWCRVLAGQCAADLQTVALEIQTGNFVETAGVIHLVQLAPEVAPFPIG